MVKKASPFPQETPPPRILEVAGSISKIQFRRAEILHRIAVLELELTKLEEEGTNLDSQQNEFVRELDRLGVAKTVVV